MTTTQNIKALLKLIPAQSQSLALETLYEIRKADKADGFRRGLEAGLFGERPHTAQQHVGQRCGETISEVPQ